jgi:hypothetical protein
MMEKEVTNLLLQSKHPEALDAWERMHRTPNISYEMYKRNPGEIEANYSAMRQYWTPEELRAVSPLTALERLTEAGIFKPEFRLPSETPPR